MIAPGVSLSPAQRKVLHEKLGRELPAEVYETHLTGHRVLVVPVPVSDKTASGILFLPNSAVQRAKLECGSGWIISAGPLAGTKEGWSDYGALAEDPTELLGHYVTFKMYSGTPLRIGDADEEHDWTGELVVLYDKEVMTISAGVQL